MEIPKIKEAKPNREDFKKKIKARKIEKQPDGFHYNPHYATFDTFGKLSLDIAEKKNNRIKQKSMFTSQRFGDPKKEKKLGASTPGPGQYPLIAHWSGKPEKGKKKDEEKKKNWMNLITKGIEKSIYYS